MPRLSWRKQPNEQGLASIGQQPRGLELRYGGEYIASVAPITKGRFNVVGWYFTAVSDEFGVPLINTYLTKRWVKQDDAKSECDKYVRGTFKVPAQQLTDQGK